MAEASMGQIMSGAGIVFVVGLGIVFIALFVIILILVAEAQIFKSIGNKKKAPAPVAETPAPAVAPVVEAAEEENDEEIAAVIAAAIAMMTESGNGLVVRSVRRIGANTPAWSNSGRQEYVNTRY